MKITKKVTFVAKEGHVKQLSTLLNSMIDASRNEQGCLLYDIFQYENNPNKFIVLESWADEEALEGHKHSKHYMHYKAHYEVHTAEKSSDNLNILGDLF
jgi:quinol monooxygenase YgiN